ncbi:metal dependent phosphohydrolase [Candidatus Magnetoovum chiemensis]|nr:metal dependent phosphohydrolase [Candidatus Magnetoovum chiemensis]
MLKKQETDEIDRAKRVSYNSAREINEKNREQDSPFDLLKKIQLELDALLNALDREMDFSSKTQNISETLQKLCGIDEDLALGSIMLSKISKYSIRQQIHSAIICEIISKFLSWDKSKRLSLICAALTMNISIIELQDMLNKQKTRLSETQEEIIRNHPKNSVRILNELGVKDQNWLNAVLWHHECLDGSGYPFGLRDDEISHQARILKLADIYCARINTRLYRQAMPVNMAIREIFFDSSHIIDETLTQAFIKKLGIYQPGSFVKLRNKEISVVTQVGVKAYSPIVHSIVKSNGFPYMQPLKRDTSESDELRIAEVITQAPYEVNQYQLWGYGIYKRSKTYKRKHIRYKSEIQSIIFDLERIIKTHATIVNLSDAGCLLRVLKEHHNNAFTINKEYYLTFRVSELEIAHEDVPLEIKNVKDKRGYFLYGGEFNELKSDAWLTINSYVEILRSSQ